MDERSTAQDVAAENWGYLKSQVRYWRSWKYTPSSHPRAYAMWVADMRNAWAAYHAGAPWMTGASWGVAVAHAREVAQLTAEVERWQVRADDLRKLVSAKRIEAERLRGQLAKTRSGVERLRSERSQLREWLHQCGNESVARGCDASVVAYSSVLAQLDALAREDGV